MKDDLKNIITLTVNPALDLHIRINEGREEVYRRDFGGKGINVSRALHSVNVENLCMLVLGKEDKDRFLFPLLDTGLAAEWVYVDGNVRENKNIQDGDREHVVRGRGAKVDGNAAERLRKKLLPHIKADTVLCFSGSIPDGSDKEAILSVLKTANRHGARLILDSASLTAEDIISLNPYMIKPNLEEAEAILGKSLADKEPELICGELLALGSEKVLLTLGKEGMLLGTGRGVYRKSGIPIVPVSTTGAGDSATAGFIAAKALGMNDADTLRLSVAFATAACLSEGSQPPDPCQIKELFYKS